MGVCLQPGPKSGENSDIAREISWHCSPFFVTPTRNCTPWPSRSQAVDARIKALIADMLETMYDANGIGLAATQVDVHERLIVIDVSEKRNEPMVLINPEIVWASADKQVNEEGCLSVPGIYDGVERASCHQGQRARRRGPVAHG
jgi:peptide deformylase